MFDPLQSAYRDKHSTETALIKVQNDILSALDAGSSAILLMLDLSAAFDTIDHDILLSRLCNVYGITGNALDWFRSYLTGRIPRVVIENAVSGYQELGFGVPQGSVLVPNIYCMHTKPVSDIIQRHGLSHHSYADDTQLYMTMDHSNNNWRDGLARIQLCVSEIREWMNQNMLKLNNDKTELIVFTSKYKQDLYNDLSITIGDTVVDCSSQVKDLGVIFDRVLSLRVVYPLPWPLLVGGVRCSRLWSTSQLLRPSGQKCSHSGGVCPQIQGRQCGAYVGAVEEMMCVVCVDVTEGA